MADKVQFSGTTGDTVYFIARNSAAQPGTSNLICEDYNASHLSDYAVAMTEQGASGYFAGEFPALPPGSYSVAAYKQAGGSPAESDKNIACGNYDWDGANLIQAPTLIFSVTVEVHAGGVPLLGAVVKVDPVSGGAKQVRTGSDGQATFLVGPGVVNVSIASVPANVHGFRYAGTAQTIDGSGNWNSTGTPTLLITMTPPG